MEIENYLDNCVERLKYMTDDEEKKLDEYLQESSAFILVYDIYKMEKRLKSGDKDTLRIVLKERASMELIERRLRHKGMSEAEAKKFVKSLKEKIKGIL
jgi:hypothetical protein